MKEPNRRGPASRGGKGGFSKDFVFGDEGEDEEETDKPKARKAGSATKWKAKKGRRLGAKPPIKKSASESAGKVQKIFATPSIAKSPVQPNKRYKIISKKSMDDTDLLVNLYNTIVCVGEAECVVPE